MKNNIYAIVTARMASSRFYGKAIAPIDGFPALEYLISRIKKSQLGNNIIITTTKHKEDDIIADIARKNCFIYRSDASVITKVFKAAQKYKVDTIVDITGDCPLICPFQIDALLNLFKTKNADFVSNVLTRSWPRGFDIQIYKTSVLEECRQFVNTPAHINHLGWNIVNYSGKLKKVTMYNYPAMRWYWFPEWGLTLDYEEDLKVINIIAEKFRRKNYKYSAIEIIKYLKINPEILNINKSVHRKTAGEG